MLKADLCTKVCGIVFFQLSLARFKPERRLEKHKSLKCKLNRKKKKKKSLPLLLFLFACTVSFCCCHCLHLMSVFPTECCCCHVCHLLCSASLNNKKNAATKIILTTTEKVHAGLRHSYGEANWVKPLKRYNQTSYTLYLVYFHYSTKESILSVLRHTPGRNVSMEKSIHSHIRALTSVLNSHTAKQNRAKDVCLTVLTITSLIQHFMIVVFESSQ